MADSKIKPGTKAWLTRQQVWRHNSFLGHARMMEMQCINICSSKTATDEAKKIAAKIGKLATELGEALRTRRDQ